MFPVKIPTDIFFVCTGSAMVDLAYEIAKGANFKFNTMMMGNLVRLRSSIDLLSIYRLRFVLIR